MKALIVGGGVAGPATAMALQRVGVDAVVLERRAGGDATEGSYFTIAPNGLDALDLLDALPIAREAGFPSTDEHDVRRVRPAAGGARSRCPPGRRPGGPHREAVRSSRPGCSTRRSVAASRSAAGPRSPPSRATAAAPSVTLADGVRLAADLVVGADGVRSRVRPVIDPAAPGRPLRRTHQLRRDHPRHRTGDDAPPGGLALRLRRPRLLRRPSDAGRRRRVVRQRTRTGDHPRAPRRHEPGGVAAPAGRPPPGGRRAGRRARRRRDARAGRRQHLRPPARPALDPRPPRPRRRRRPRAVAELGPGRVDGPRGRGGAGYLGTRPRTDRRPTYRRHSAPTSRRAGPASNASSRPAPAAAAPRPWARWGAGSRRRPCRWSSATSSPTAAPPG